jgi:hypothetical protein
MCEGIHTWRNEIFEKRLRFIDAGIGIRVKAG